ncbi:MAG: hypothetical protein AB2L09_06280 [Coriobacteriia bacterium]
MANTKRVGSSHWIHRLVFSAVFVATLFSVSAAFGISRNEVLARGQTWVDNPVPYSQGAYFGGYRTDCSGYASMCLATGYSWSTRTFYNVAYPIPAEALQPGDLMLKAGSHVRVFYAWVDAAHTQYVAYEQTTPATQSIIKSFADDIANGYIPYRYNKITDSPEPWNLIRNPTFDVWSRGSAVWWDASQDASGSVAACFKAATHTSASSISITNRHLRSSDTYTLSQTVAASAGSVYELSAWAVTTSAPELFRMTLSFLNSSGTTIAQTSTTGDSWGINASAYKQMSSTVQAPAGTAKAKVTFELLHSSPDATEEPTTGALVDDVCLRVVSPMAVYRFYNVKNGSHFYTASGDERDIVASRYASTYTYEGTAYAINITSPSANTPLYRFYNVKNGSHFYTASEDEKNTVIARWPSVYTFEGVAYNVSISADNATPVYRFYNKKNGSHFYTASAEERDIVVAKYSSTYTLEGTAFYLPR